MLLIPGATFNSSFVMIRFPFFLLIISLTSLVSYSAAQASALGAQAQTTIVYEEDDSVFPNPERGFYFYQSLDNLDHSVLSLRDERGMTLIWGKISLDDYRETEVLPDSLLENLQQGFDLARMAGAKVIVRIKYGFKGPDGTYRSYEDPALEIIEGHILQLEPLFADNADVIAFFEAGMLGPWGEWHSSSLAQDPELRRHILFKFLDHTPMDRMVVVRYPALKQSIFQSDEPFDPSLAYDGSHISRVGHHNDCFLSSEYDVGTYNRGHMSMQEEIEYLSAETRYTLFGGETCRLHDRSLRENALYELEKLHASYLNSSYYPDVLERWREEGTMDVVERRLGARFVLETLELPDHARPGQTIALRLTLKNTGFASLYNPRPASLVLTSPEGRKWMYPIEEDPRHWKPGETVTLELVATLPSDLPAGDYRWSLHLPDPAPLLADNPAYAYRVANLDVWDRATGENILLNEWSVLESPAP